MAKVNKYDEVISQTLLELNEDYSTYQRLHRKYHGDENSEVRRIHELLVGLCNDIRKKIVSKGSR